MDVNNISNQNINSLGNVQQQVLGGVATGQKIDKSSDDVAVLAISENLIMRRSELATSLQSLNEGIAMSEIAQRGLEDQKDILEQVRTKTLEAMNTTTSQEGKYAIKNEIQKQLEQFVTIANNTTFNNQNLLRPNGKDNELVISTANNSFSIGILDTSMIGNTILSATANSNFNNEDLSNILSKIDAGSAHIDNFLNDFSAAENQMKSSAKNTISEQVNLARANSSLTDADFGKEVTDFNKSNVMTQVGYLVASQANAVQEHNVRLLR